MLVISNRPRSSHWLDFEITRAITPGLNFPPLGKTTIANFLPIFPLFVSCPTRPQKSTPCFLMNSGTTLFYFEIEVPLIKANV